MTRPLTVVLIVASISLCAGPLSAAAGSTTLSMRTAKHALRVNLARAYGIHHVSASCRRRLRSKVTCRWSGRRGASSYRGRATVGRSGRSTVVQLTNVHRV